MPEPSDRAKIALEVLEEAFLTVSGGYLARMRDVAVAEPWAADKIRNLALAQKIAGEAEAHIRAIVANGVIEAEQRAYRQKIEKMSPERRNILGL